MIKIENESGIKDRTRKSQILKIYSKQFDQQNNFKMKQFHDYLITINRKLEEANNKYASLKLQWTKIDFINEYSSLVLIFNFNINNKIIYC